MEEKFNYLRKKDIEKIRTAVNLHTPVEITSYTLPRNMENYMQETLRKFLVECRQEYLTEQLSFSLGELLTNSKKANTKRVYFKEKNLDITDEADYNRGMESFKSDTLSNIGHYLSIQKKQGLYIKLLLQMTSDFIKVEIRNNSVLTVFETERIQEKIRKARQYNSMEEVYMDILDQTEGSGLGIIIMILMLQKVGLSSENYQIFSVGNETITKIILPLNQKIKSDFLLLSKEFVRNQKKIPVRRDKFEKLNQLLADGSTSRQVLTDFIARDATLSIITLKEFIAEGNSALSLTQAVDRITPGKLAEIFSTENPEITLITPDERAADIWNHCFFVAFAAYNIAANCLPQETAAPEAVYICGLIHDIERILLHAASEEQLIRLKELCTNYGISARMLETFFDDRVHSQAGKLILEKWNFPKEISEMVNFHHDPENAPAEISDMTAAVYLADIMQNYNDKNIEYYQINKTILKKFGIKTERKFRFMLWQINYEFIKNLEK